MRFPLHPGNLSRFKERRTKEYPKKTRTVLPRETQRQKVEKQNNNSNSKADVKRKALKKNAGNGV